MVLVFVFHYFKHGKVQIKSWLLCLSIIISNTGKCRSNHGGCVCPSLFQTDKVQIRSRWLSLKVQVEPSWLPSSFIVSDTSSSKSDVAVSKTRWRRSNLAGCLCLSLSQTREAAGRVLAVAFVFHYLQHKKAQIESRRFPSEDPLHPPPPPLTTTTSHWATDNPVRPAECARGHPLLLSGKSFYCSAIVASRLPGRRPIRDCYTEET